MGKEIRGIIPAVITPFTSDERVDEASFRKVLNLMIDHGVQGLFPVGTGGEFFALTRDEKERLMAVAVEETAGRAFVMPNVGAITTAESIALARHAEAVGCDAVSVVTPFYLLCGAKFGRQFRTSRTVRGESPRGAAACPSR